MIGPSLPLPPSDILFENISSTSVTISWRVHSVSYTPETYTVHYGTSNSESSQTVHGPTQLQEILNINGAEYNVTLTDLKPYTQYYYYVNATNTEGTTQSNVSNFTTLEDGMYICIDTLLQYFTLI